MGHIPSRASHLLPVQVKTTIKGFRMISFRISIRSGFNQRIQIRIRNPDPDPGVQKGPTKVEKN
jgi:hypothetical protein